MDRQRAAGLLIPALAASALLAAKAAELSVIHSARWLAPGADPALALGTHATECLPAIDDPDRRFSVEVGRAAFRTPMLLGGQAARAGVSCETCHQNGRNNPDFDFPGLSGAPGTADVTTALFSSYRDDGIDNPKPIPNLSGPKSALKQSQDPSTRVLETFLHGTVTEEFDGAEPPPTVLKGLADYVRALSPDACPPLARAPLRAEDDIDNALRAARVAVQAMDRRDAATAALMVEAARSQLGLIDERYDAPGLAPARARLRSAAADLTADLAAIRAKDPHARERLSTWLAQTPEWTAVVIAQEPASLFNPQRLAAGRAAR